MIFEILKIIHIVSVVSWMAGLLYLPRIFVYHADKNITKETSNTFKVMEKKLYRYIMTPAAILTWISGLMMIASLSLSIWLIIGYLLVCMARGISMFPV